MSIRTAAADTDTATVESFRPIDTTSTSTIVHNTVNNSHNAESDITISTAIATVAATFTVLVRRRPSSSSQCPSLSRLPPLLQPSYQRLATYAVLQIHVKASIKALMQSGFRAKRVGSRPSPSPQPTPVPVYFTNISRRQIRKLKRSLQVCMPKWVVLSVSFIGASPTEILYHSTLVDRLDATLHFFRYKHLPEYNSKEMVTADSPTEMKHSYKANGFRNWIKLGDSTASTVLKRWYAAQADEKLKAD